MAITTPYGNPNWFIRQNRLNEKKSASKRMVDDPSKMAMDLYDAGIQLNGAGGANPTRDFGELLRLNSSQISPMSRGFRAGANSSLGQPMNSMYANNPGFFNRDRVKQFQEQIQQRNQAASQSRPVDGALIEKRGFGNPVQQTPSGMKLDNALLEKRGFDSPQKAPTTSQATPSSSLQDRASGIRLLREMSQTPLQIQRNGGETTIQGQYGTGSATTVQGPRKEGMIGGRPFSEVMQGLAEKPGIARPGDKYQPKGMSAEEIAKARKAKK